TAARSSSASASKSMAINIVLTASQASPPQAAMAWSAAISRSPTDVAEGSGAAGISACSLFVHIESSSRRWLPVAPRAKQDEGDVLLGSEDAGASAQWAERALP